MKFSKEARIGLLVAAALLVFFFGFYFLKGSNLYTGEYQYYTYYDNVQGLIESSPVQIKGMTVGRVSDIELNGRGKVKVTLSLSKRNPITRGTVAKLVSTDLLGTKAISLELSHRKEILEDEETLSSEVEGGIIDAISVEITPLLRDMRHAVSTLDSALVTVNNVLDIESRENLRQSIANIDVATANFSQLSNRLNAEGAQLASVIRNTNSITTNLASNNERISRILNNTEIASNQLSRAPIEQTMRELQTTISQLQVVVNKINSSEGSLGKLVNDAALYNNLNSSLCTLTSLMADIEAHPARYINVSIFGRRNQ